MMANPDPDLLKLVPTRNQEFEFDDEFLVHVRDPKRTLFVNGPTAIIWGLCDGETDIGSIIGQIKQAYPEDSDDIDADVIKTVLMLAERKALVLSPEY